MHTKQEIADWLKTEGAKVVHQQWRNTMLDQGREVSSERMNWEVLSEADKALDFEIATEVINEFLKWLGGNPC